MDLKALLSDLPPTIQYIAVIGLVMLILYVCLTLTRMIGAKRGENLISIIEADGLRIGHLGDLGHMPDEAQLAAIQNLDLMLIPIGGFFTIDTNQAIEIIQKARPRCAIAMHFKNAYCDFPISDESQFRSELNAELLPNEIEITKETRLPKAAILTYKA